MATAGEREDLPSLGVSLTPILLPIVLILLGTVAAALKVQSPWIAFLSHRVTALLAGVLAAFWLGVRRLSGERLAHAVAEGLRASGLVLFITGAGGSLAQVLNEAGVGKVLAGSFTASTSAPLLLVWLIAGLLKIAQGSGTVAMVTAAGIMAPMMPQLAISPVLVALAAFSGSLFGAHINDSGFWVTAKLLGLSTQGGIKVYTLSCAIMAVVSLILVLLLALAL